MEQEIQNNDNSSTKDFVFGLLLSFLLLIIIYVPIIWSYVMFLLDYEYYSGIGMGGLLYGLVLNPITISVPFLILNLIASSFSKGNINKRRGIKIGYCLVILIYLLYFSIPILSNYFIVGQKNLMDKALTQNNENICFDMISRYGKFSCIKKIAEQRGNTSVCSRISEMTSENVLEGPYYISHCEGFVEGLALQKSDINICDNYNDFNNPHLSYEMASAHDHCYRSVLQKIGNPQLFAQYCSLMKTDQYKNISPCK